MTADDDLAQRIRFELRGIPNLVEKNMFGGIGFLIQGNMACGINKGDLIIRVGPEASSRALAQSNTRPFDMTGRPMAGWLMVSPPGYQSDADLKNWINQGVAFALTLPPKSM
jgi:TfoX/Sxy family transcriptional regulator of competence genes